MDCIKEVRETIRRDLRGVDNSCHVKGKNSLEYILNSIDIDSSITDDDLHRKYNIWHNYVMLHLRRDKNGKAMQDYLMDTNTSAKIMQYLYTYLHSRKAVYKVDDNLLRFFSENEDYKSYIDQVFDEPFEACCLFVYNNLCYYADAGGDGKGSITIYVPNSNDEKLGHNFITYTVDYEIGNSGILMSKLTSVCGNKSCPHYKSSTASIFEGGSRQVFCSMSDISKCKQCTKAGLLEPLDAIDMLCAIISVKRNRPTSFRRSVKRDDYEHLPVAEVENDVVIYYGGSTEKKALPFKTIDEVNAIPSSHASPREHFRRGCSRRAYTRKDGVKVKATTVKSTTVNKGHTKTNYVLKERRS